MTSFIFITREKFSCAVESLSSALTQASADDEIILTDIGYPHSVRRELSALLDGFPRHRWIDFAGYVLPNAQLNAAVARVVDDGPVVVLENDVVVYEGAVTALCASLRAGEADVVSPLIMHGDTGFPHYDPPVSIILHDESDASYTSFVERIPRHGWLPLTGKRTVFHIERHAFAATAAALRAIVPLNEELNTREQIEFSLRAFDCGARMVFEPAAVVSYHAPREIDEMDRDLFAWRWDPVRAEASNDYVQKTWSLRHFTRSTTFVERMNRVLQGPKSTL